MGRFLLFEDEQLVVRFRPHGLSYLPRYGGSFLWLAPGAAGAFTTLTVEADHLASWGLVGFAFVALLSGLVNARFRRRPMAFVWFIVLAALGLIVVDVLGALPAADVEWTVPLVLGGAAVVARLVWWELDRLGRVHFLTTDRLVVRGGLGNRREHTRYLKEIRELRSVRGVFGQLFDYGDLTLVLARQIRGGKEPSIVEDKQVLSGIGRLEEVKHQVEQLMEEQRLPFKDRRRRVEERRVKESMRRLATWMRREARTRPRA